MRVYLISYNLEMFKQVKEFCAKECYIKRKN